MFIPKKNSWDLWMFIPSKPIIINFNGMIIHKSQQFWWWDVPNGARVLTQSHK